MITGMPEFTFTTGTTLLVLSTIITLLVTIGSYIVFGNNEGNIIIIISFLFAVFASYAAATDLGMPTSRRRNSMSRASVGDTAAALTLGLIAFVISLIFGIIMMISSTSNSTLLGFFTLLASALSLIGALLAQREFDE